MTVALFFFFGECDFFLSKSSLESSSADEFFEESDAEGVGDFRRLRGLISEMLTVGVIFDALLP